MTSAPPTPTTRDGAPPTPTSARRTPSFNASSASASRLSTASPALSRRGSRSSLGVHGTTDTNDKRLTPKRSISNLISGLREAQATMEPIAEPIVLTAADVAKAHFERELERMTQDNEAETLVVLHDACYGHRFSRPKTSRGSLSMIVERPERLHAGVLGAATAFVRMGGHHEGGRNAPDPERQLDGPPPFKIRRTAREMDVTSTCVTNVHGTAWMQELKGMAALAGARLAKGEKELRRSASTDGAEKRTLHQGDLYLCQESLSAFQGALGGVADAVDAVFAPEVSTKRAFVAVRPPGHHCSADFPSGFCWLNNVHVGLEYAAQTHGLTHAAIIDFDLHHGDGSQAITWARNAQNLIKRQNGKNNKQKLSLDIGYYSLHDINSYPCELGDDEKVQAASLCVENAHCQSVWNVHLQPWKTEDEFWELYESRYRILIDKARLFLRHHTSRVRAEGKTQPKAALFISAGFDASEHEGEGMQRHKVNVPTDFYARFTKDMVKLAQEADSGCEGRVISVLEGGYSDRALCSGVLSHLSGLCTPRAPAHIADIKQQSSLGFSMQGSGAMDLEQQLNSLSLNGNASEQDYDTLWWSTSNLTALEMRVNPPPPSAPGKKLRAGPQPTYATPTESFAYKVVDAQNFARSVSGTMRHRETGAPIPKVNVSAVDWVTATQELSKLLIPQDRQTKSCTAEELAGPKIEKKAVASVPIAEAEKPRQLRTRAAAVRPVAARAESHDRRPEQQRVVSRADRRRTIADFPIKSEEVAGAVQTRRPSRRSSMASSIGTAEPDSFVPAPPMPKMPPIATTTNMMRPPPAPTAMNGGVQVKKTRIAPTAKPVAARRAPAPASAPQSPMPIVAAALEGDTNPAPQQNIPQQPRHIFTPQGDSQLAQGSSDSSGVPRQQRDHSPVAGTSDLDALVTKTSRLRLNVPASREEHDRKLKEKLAAERRASALKGAETRRLNAAARKAKEAVVPSAATSALTAAQKARLGPLSRPAQAASQATPTGSAQALSIISQQAVNAEQLVVSAPQQTSPTTAPGAPMLEPAVLAPVPAPATPNIATAPSPPHVTSSSPSSVQMHTEPLTST